MSANATLNRSIIKRRRRGKPYDHRDMRKDWTDEWFLKKRIAIVALTNHVGHQIKDKCRDMGIMFFLRWSHTWQCSKYNMDARDTTQILHG